MHWGLGQGSQSASQNQDCYDASVLDASCFTLQSVFCRACSSSNVSLALLQSTHLIDYTSCEKHQMVGCYMHLVSLQVHVVHSISVSVMVHKTAAGHTE